MIERNLSATLTKAAALYPVVTVTGPRQSGKTTLCRSAFPEKAHVSLEPLDVRDYARRDPRAFLAEHAQGAIFDEVQHAPELLSYLQVAVDEHPAAGRFVLTGSQHFALSAQIAQSLAGRTAVLELLPPSIDELQRFPHAPHELLDVLWMGAYPRIHDRQIPASRWLADYLTTYVQRDVRQVLNIGDLTSFTAFVRLCAGRSAGVLNLSALGADAGVTHHTARAWLAVLETSYLVFRVPPWQRSLKKQLTRAPKLHFVDSGLLCHLLGIRSAEELRHHPLRGAVFESWVAAEIYKARAHRGLAPELHYYRDHKGHEVDLVLESPASLTLIEVKSGTTVAGDFFTGLERLRALLRSTGENRPVAARVVFGGELRQSRSDAVALPWREMATAKWTDES